MLDGVAILTENVIDFLEGENRTDDIVTTTLTLLSDFPSKCHLIPETVSLEAASVLMSCDYKTAATTMIMSAPQSELSMNVETESFRMCLAKRMERFFNERTLAHQKSIIIRDAILSDKL